MVWWTISSSSANKIFKGFRAHRIVRLVSSGRKRIGDRGAASRLGLDFDRAAELLDDVFADRQARFPCPGSAVWW